MSKISDIVNKHIHEYDIAKTGKWLEETPPPENTFGKNELYSIGRSIISELEGLLSDSLIKK